MSEQRARADRVEGLWRSRVRQLETEIKSLRGELEEANDGLALANDHALRCERERDRAQARLAEAEALLREIKEADETAAEEIEEMGIDTSDINNYLTSKISAFLAAGEKGETSE